MVLHLGWDTPLLRASSERKTGCSKTYRWRGLLSLGEYERPTPAPVWDTPLIQTIHRSQINLPEMLSPPQKHLSDITVRISTGPRTAVDHSRQQCLNESLYTLWWVEQWRHALCRCFQSPPSECPQNWGRRPCALPQVLLCVFGVCLRTASSRERESLTSLWDILGAPAMCLAPCSVLRL